MQKMRWLRVVLGGLLAGIVINVCEFLTNGVWLKADWAAAMQALGKPGEMAAGQMAAFVLWAFVVGIVAVWLYAAIRPRYGPGAKTAVVAALAVWLLGFVLAGIPPLVLNILPARLMLLGFAVGLVEVIAGTLLGAWPYREGEAGMVRGKAAA